ncbi:DNA alkylation repair protein [Melittangium boletus]|uniref:DNA alkylation repair protein n=1 Tax=Melittangium boletus TaxID=83453 RepID=UPI003DA4BEB2
MTAPAPPPAPALKDIFDLARLRHIAAQTAAVHPSFDARRFVKEASRELEALSLMQRLRRVTETLHATLPEDFPTAVDILRRLAPRLEHRFVTLVLPDYVALYGERHFDLSLEALRFFTPFGSSEFGVRPFLQKELARTLRVMEQWSRDPDDHVRRLASEGCRPLLPWASRIDALRADPSRALPILENLRADPSPYVRKSVANHLNDITKVDPGWVLDRLGQWPLEEPATAWIARHALRNLVKKGDARALALLGAGARAQVRLQGLTVSPRALRRGEQLTLSVRLESTSDTPQRLVVDYAVHYVKKSGATSAKVFKWKTLTLAPGAVESLSRRQRIRDFSTRTHYAGRHEVDLLVNGERLARSFFDLED